ncbi:MAG: Gfo/Idh/MocA family oxidoreductase [Anaerolineaceae bacterium]|nr:Gfo/Idh/MocA family oxidoreductase [Anaerolineaceae bacterium]
MKDEINVALIGTKFMGRAHSNAFIDVPFFFDLPLKPIRKVACGRNQQELNSFASKFGWEETETDWRKIIERDDIHLVDICTANDTHAAIAIAAAKAGKHVICEKPLAMTTQEAQEMLTAAKENNITHMTAFNYRRVPALLIAKKLIDEGKIGKIHHFNAVYYQDWLVDPQFPIVWRHDVKIAGSGAHGDMNAHIVDLARFLVGEISSVCGAQEIFVKERPFASRKGLGTVTADDATYFMANFNNGTLGSFLATRFATGRKNFLRVEIFGSEGSISFNLERMNELEYFSRSDESGVQGFRTIVATEGDHDYISAWWPPGHIIGWEHTFIHEVKDFIEAIANKSGVQADFYDGLRCQQVLDAVVSSSQSRQWISIPAKEI